ncbi:cytochrome c, class I [Thiocapsa marina 5811]|uniref:Cytochrome c, class I n=2 Tax=Thiocapsa marina TaxID=244573 RepID=F9U713_9GAMM|nr:cytochrome c, class I [Thiocapsa marina 5811]
MFVVCCFGVDAVAAASPERQMLAAHCNGCHGLNGVSAGPASPSFAGFDRQFLIRVLQEFRNGERVPTIMDRIMTGYTAGQIRQLATYYAEQSWQSADVPLDPGAVAEGKRLHDEACAECHEEEGRYQDRDTPRIAGQWPDYLVFQLLTYRDRPEAIPQPTKMRESLVGLADADLQALAQFYASQR